MSDVGSIADVAFALRFPLLALALFALAVGIVELGRVTAEIVHRRRRDPTALRAAADRACEAVVAGDRHAGARALLGAISSGAMAQSVACVLADVGTPRAVRVPQWIADFDHALHERLERTRILERVGPALGMIALLILLAPALTSHSGDGRQLSDSMRAAAGVSSPGLLAGVLALAISRMRRRLYAQDLSDLRLIAATLETGVSSGRGRPGSFTA